MVKKLSLGGGLETLLNKPSSNPVSNMVGVKPLAGDFLIAAELSVIDDNPTQPRVTIDQVSFDELCLSIKEREVQIPIIVRPGKKGRYILVAGQQRLKACRTLELKTIPAIVRDLDDATAHLLSIIENVARSPVPVLEEAVALKLMRDSHGFTNTKIAGALGKTDKWVSEIIALSDLPASIISAAKSGYVAHVSQFTQLRLAYSVNPTVVDSFLLKLKEPLTFKAAKALYDSVTKKKEKDEAKPKPSKRLSKKAIEERIEMASEKLDSNLSDKQLSAMDLLAAIDHGDCDSEVKLKLMVIALFPTK
jgi:ParB family chromosome partitioning protein